jgi:HNH endonuclease
MRFTSVPIGTRSIYTYPNGAQYWKIKIGPNQWRFEHRVIMERMLGRKLESEERVHHKNDNGLDNTPDNLQLFVTNREHLDHHKKWGHGFDVCQQCRTTKHKHIARGLCMVCYQRLRRRERGLVNGRKTLAGRWALDYSHCRQCNSTRRPHMAHGLCDCCYSGAIRRQLGA